MDNTDACGPDDSSTCGKVVMNNRKDLRNKAVELRKLLEQYASSDPDVREAYEWTKPLLNDVESGRVTSPTKFPYGWIFFRGENNLPAYPDLCGAAADFADALEAV